MHSGPKVSCKGIIIVVNDNRISNSSRTLAVALGNVQMHSVGRLMTHEALRNRSYLAKTVVACKVIATALEHHDSITVLEFLVTERAFKSVDLHCPWSIVAGVHVDGVVVVCHNETNRQQTECFVIHTNEIMSRL